MDFDFTEEQKAFREEVRSFLKEELEAGSFVPRQNSWIEGYSREFSKKLSQRGWIGLTWPTEWGGAIGTASKHGLQSCQGGKGQ